MSSTPTKKLLHIAAEARSTLGMTQGELGPALGASHRTASRWATGLSSPGEASIRRLALIQVQAPVDAALATEAAAHTGERLEDLGVGPPSPPTVAAAPVADVAKVAPVAPPQAVAPTARKVSATADSADASPRTVRPWLAVAFKRAAELGFGAEEVGALVGAYIRQRIFALPYLLHCRRSTLTEDMKTSSTLPKIGLGSLSTALLVCAFFSLAPTGSCGQTLVTDNTYFDAATSDAPIPYDQSATGMQATTSMVVVPTGVYTTPYVVAAFQDYTPGYYWNVNVNSNGGIAIGSGTSGVGWSRSTDGGKNFSYRGRLPVPSGYAVVWGDVAIASAPYYYYVNPSQQGINYGAVFLATRCVTTSTMNSVLDSYDAGLSPDPVEIGHTNTESISGVASQICVFFSSDYGDTFTFLESPTTDLTFVDGISMDMSEDGTVCLAQYESYVETVHLLCGQLTGLDAEEKTPSSSVLLDRSSALYRADRGQRIRFNGISPHGSHGRFRRRVRHGTRDKFCRPLGFIRLPRRDLERLGHR